MGDALQDLGFQVGDVIGSNEVNEVIRIWFARLAPGTSRNSAGRIAGDEVRDTEDHEFHERLAGWSAAGIYRRIVPTHGHWRRRQKAATTLEIDTCQEIQRRFGQMNMG